MDHDKLNNLVKIKQLIAAMVRVTDIVAERVQALTA